MVEERKCVCKTPNEFLKYWDDLECTTPDDIVMDYILTLFEEYKALFNANKELNKTVRELKSKYKKNKEAILNIPIVKEYIEEKKEDFKELRKCDNLTEYEIQNLRRNK